MPDVSADTTTPDARPLVAHAAVIQTPKVTASILNFGYTNVLPGESGVQEEFANEVVDEQGSVGQKQSPSQRNVRSFDTASFW